MLPVARTSYDDMMAVAKGDQKLDERTQKVVSILESSDIVWSKYGSDTIEALASRILLSLS